MVYSADGYIITVTSLVDNVGKITIVFADGKQASAQVVGRDPRTGIALLKETSIKGLAAVHFGDAHLMRRGSSIFSISNAYGLHNSLSAGVIAAIRPTGGPLPHPLFQTDTVTQPGSTGAPLFNTKGEVIGMFASYYSKVIGLAVTSNIIKDVVWAVCARPASRAACQIFSASVRPRSRTHFRASSLGNAPTRLAF